MSKKYPAFQFYPADFLVGVAELTTEAVGAYILLLCRQWDKGSIPDDQQKCAVIARTTPDAIASLWHKFGIVVADGRQNERMETVRASLIEYSEKQAASAGKRWGKSERNANAMPSHQKTMPMHSKRIAKRIANALPTQCQDDATSMPNGCSSSSSSSSILPLSSPKGDSTSENDSQHSRSAEPAEKKETPPADEPPAPGSREAIDLTEREICALFPGRRQLGSGYKRLLGDIADSLPLPAETWRHLRTMLIAKKNAGPEPENYDLRRGFLTSADNLAKELLSAAEIARTWFTGNGSSASASTEKKSAPPVACPDGWDAWFSDHYPHSMAIRFAAAPPEIRQEFRESRQAFPSASPQPNRKTSQADASRSNDEGEDKRGADGTISTPAKGPIA
jgi:uncharacterized protein YdaU (DUF1376 family)